jgi:hypothetical protein
MAGIVKSLRPFHEASLAFFAAGAPVIIVYEKFSQYVSYGTVQRWYNDWADLKGIPLESRHRARTKNTPRREQEFDRVRAEILREKSKRKRKERDLEIASRKEEREAMLKASPEWKLLDEAMKRHLATLNQEQEA